MLVIIDYGVGNLGSIQNMLKKLGVDNVISSNKLDIENADKLILPGVGSFDYGMTKLTEGGFVDILNEKVLIRKTPILGICLGVQLFTQSSEEGTKKGLGWFNAQTVKFNFPNESIPRKIPNMGWANTKCNSSSKLFTNMYEEPRFYFVHSYHLKSSNAHEVVCTSEYGYEFAAGLEKDNIIGVQFHPEKSHKYGMATLKNYCELY